MLKQFFMLLHKVYDNYPSNFIFFLHKFPFYLCTVDLTEQAAGRGHITLFQAMVEKELCMLKW